MMELRAGQCILLAKGVCRTHSPGTHAGRALSARRLGRGTARGTLHESGRSAPSSIEATGAAEGLTMAESVDDADALGRVERQAPLEQVDCERVRVRVQGLERLLLLIRQRAEVVAAAL